MPLPHPDLWDRLPSVSMLRSRPVVSFVRHGAIWEIGWNGSWVQAFKGRYPPGPEGPDAKKPPSPRGKGG
jgi:hypothetical protein